ncbi:MAG: hypothetical protein OXC91_05895 [Rhodobacteraceae bacterium]|nr:hypothetical protein [Paracoccaceae bacterium]
MADEQDQKAKLEIEKKRSAVRRWVTYGAIGAYLILAAVVVVWLMWAGRYDLAIGVLGGVGGLAGSISGFWFGSRRSDISTAGTDTPT